MRTVSNFGIQSQTPVIDMVQVREYLRSTIRQTYKGTTPEALQQKGMVEATLAEVRVPQPKGRPRGRNPSG